MNTHTAFSYPKCIKLKTFIHDHLCTSSFDSVLVFQTQGEHQPCYNVTHVTLPHQPPRAPVTDCCGA